MQPGHAESTGVDEGGVARARPHRAGTPPWSRPRRLLLGLAAVLAAAVLARRLGPWGRPPLPRSGADFPPPPRLNAALARAEARLRESPQDIGALVELGLLHFEKGRDSYAEAINELEEARQLGSLDSRIFYCLGIMYQETGLYPFAVEEYRRFLRNHPDDRETRLLLAKLLFKQGQFGDAVNEYERLKFARPKDPLVEEFLGLSLLKAKVPERAAESFELLKGFGPLEAKRAEFYLGELAMERERWQEALDHLRAALPQNDSEQTGIAPAEIHAALAKAHLALKQPEEAKASWEAVLALTPGDAKAAAALKDLKRRFPAKKKKSKP